MTIKALCIHGHFYQPPRQDVLTGIIPQEMGTAPYKNWNEKIHAECYRPNAELGNFEHISFNIGPTLFQWMENYDPVTYKLIIGQDRVNFERHGVGNAMAQPYNHTILPLANQRDKVTQIEWGIADYIHRFGHSPAGMWLPEAAVDKQTMRILADHGIEYTVLAPWQSDTQDTNGKQPYRLSLGKNKSIAVFFYDMDLSTRVSFDPAATSDADQFVTKFIAPNFQKNDQSGKPEILIIASDGELYGHHQPFRDKFLARLLDGASNMRKIDIVYPGLYLQRYGVSASCRIKERTSWSCHHGISRWKTECGCTPHARWKAPLRDGLNRIARKLDQAYSKFLKSYTSDPWEVRNQYIRVHLGLVSWTDFAKQHFTGFLSSFDNDRLQSIMQAQIARQWMFTSCGWFFDEFDRIEPRNNVSYAAQAVYLTEKATGNPLAAKSIKALSLVQSERSGLRASDVFTETYQRCQTYDFDFLRAVV